MMIRLLGILAAATLPALAIAQAQATPPAASASKPAAHKPAAHKSAAHSKLAPSARKAVEEATAIEDDPDLTLTDADREIAKQVFVGEIPCELGATVKLRAGHRDGVFVVSTKNYRFVMHPVESRTGAIRLEDPKRGAMWLQLGNKSMLMSQKLGQRLADECQSPQQVTYAEELKKNPRPSILDSTPGPQSTSTKAP